MLYACTVPRQIALTLDRRQPDTRSGIDTEENMVDLAGTEILRDRNNSLI
jgi:hypothetical protein